MVALFSSHVSRPSRLSIVRGHERCLRAYPDRCRTLHVPRSVHIFSRGRSSLGCGTARSGTFIGGFWVRSDGESTWDTFCFGWCRLCKGQGSKSHRCEDEPRSRQPPNRGYFHPAAPKFPCNSLLHDFPPYATIGRRRVAMHVGPLRPKQCITNISLLPKHYGTGKSPKACNIKSSGLIRLFIGSDRRHGSPYDDCDIRATRDVRFGSFAFHSLSIREISLHAR